MAKILMIQLQKTPYIGTAYLHGAAKSAGHAFALSLGTDRSKVLKSVKQEKPDIVGFSCMTGIHAASLRIAALIKEHFSIPVIMGGPHPTLFPEIIKQNCIDMICRGEGEFALIDLLNALDARKSLLGIPNVWVKEAGMIHRTELRPLVYPLDTIPLADWSCYQRTGVKHSPPVVFPVRGCPFSCSYCFNAAFRKLYRVTAREYVRQFTVERTIREIEAALAVFESNPVLFQSDTLGIDLYWLEELLTAYSQKFDLPFVLLLRPEYVNESLVTILSKHACCCVAIGVESGSERVRRERLNRKYSNELLMEVADRLHRAGIKFRTYNMVGLPGETEEEMWETIRINIKMKADFPRCSIFLPMPATDLTQKAIDEGFLDRTFSYNDIPVTILSQSILKKTDRRLVQNIMYLFQTAVMFPHLSGIIHKLTHLSPNLLFRLWFYLGYAWLHRKSERRPFMSYIRHVFANREFI